MPARDPRVLRATGQAEPVDAGAVVRCILESLALKHAQTVELLASVTGTAPPEMHVVGGGARNELLCRWTAGAAGLPVLAGPGGGDRCSATCSSRRSRSASSARSRRRARSCARRSRPSIYEPRGPAPGSEARERFAGSSRCRARGGAWHERGRRRAATAIAAPEDRWDDARAGGPRRARRARLPLEPARRRPRARQPGRRQHVGEGDGRRPRRPRDARRSGSRARAPTSRRSRPPASPRCASTTCCRCANATAMDDAAMVDYLRALRRSRPTSRGRRSRRCCTRSSPAPHVDHTHPDAVIALTSSPDGRAARRGGVRRRGRLARLPAARLRHVAPDRASCSRSNPRRAPCCSTKHGLVTWGETRRGELPRARSSSSPAPRERDRRGPATGGFGLGGRDGRGSSRTTRPSALLAAALPALRGALLADADGVVLEVDRSPEAVAFASSARAPEVSQVGAPCPDHLINTKHKPLVVDFDPDARRRRRRSRAALRDGRRRVRATGTATTTSATSTTRAGRSRSTPPGRASCSCPASASSRAARDAGRARFARDLYHRAIAVRGRRGRGRRLPLAERGRGVRDRVLAARALQARAGAAARRARRPDRAGHRRRERDRPRDRAPARRARRRTSSSPT